MRYFFDSADPTKIAEANEVMRKHGIDGLDGVTTNPSLAEKTPMIGGSYRSHILHIANTSSKEYKNFRHLSAETLGTKKRGMENYDPSTCNPDTYHAEGKSIYAWNQDAVHPIIVPKVPATPEGLPAIYWLSQEEIFANATLCFNENQALMSAQAEASCVSPFIGRLNDLNSKHPELYTKKGVELIGKIVELYEENGFPTHVLTASTRTPEDIMGAFILGSDTITWREELFFYFAKEYPEIFKKMWHLHPPQRTNKAKVKLGDSVETWPGFDRNVFYYPKNEEGKPLWQTGNEAFLLSAKKSQYAIDE